MSWMNWRQPTGVCIFSLVIVSLNGCGQNPYRDGERSPGRSLCDGEPAAGGTVVLQPIDARPEKPDVPRTGLGRRRQGIVGDDGAFSVELDSVGERHGPIGRLSSDRIS